MDGIIQSFDEFKQHLKNHMSDLHKPVEINDRLYSEKDYPALKALVVDAGSFFALDSCVASKMEHNISKMHLLFSSMTVDTLISLLKDIETVFVDVVESARLFMCCGLCNAAKSEVLDGMEYWLVSVIRGSTVYESIANLVDHCKVCHEEVKSLPLH